jgi:integrase
MQAKINDQFIKTLAIPADKSYEIKDEIIKGFSLIVRPSGVMTFCLRYYNELGKRQKYTIGQHGTITTTQARKIADKRSGAVKNGQDVQAQKVQKRQQAKKDEAATLSTFIEQDYASWVTTHLKSGQEALRVLKTDFGFLAQRRMDQITPWDIQKWSAEQLKKTKPLTPSTINRRVATLKSVLSKAKEWGFISSNPLAGMKRLKVDNVGRIRYLTDDEERRLRFALEKRQEQQRAERDNYNAWRTQRHAKPLPIHNERFTDHLMPMVLLALNTGMRRGELFDLQWQDVNAQEHYLTVAGATAKSQQSRHLPLNNEALSVLQDWSSSSVKKGLVFPSPRTGKRFDNINSAWDNLMKESHLSDFRFHDLRHSFASKLVMRGVDLYTVKELMGHANIEVTQRYAHFAPEHKGSAVALLDTVS